MGVEGAGDGAERSNRKSPIGPKTGSILMRHAAIVIGWTAHDPVRVARRERHRDNRRMGMEDRDWYWKERQRKERLHYDPKAVRRWRGDASSSVPRSGRPGFGTIRLRPWVN